MREFKEHDEICLRCGEVFKTKANNAKLCPSCRYERNKEQARERARKKRAGTYKPKRIGRPKKQQAPPTREPAYQPTICWGCANAVPRTVGGRYYGCAWSEALDPVPGWEVKHYNRPNGISTNVRWCPEFIPDSEAEKVQRFSVEKLLDPGFKQTKAWR